MCCIYCSSLEPGRDAPRLLMQGDVDVIINVTPAARLQPELT
jgi:chromosome segregation ATPase